MGKILKIGRPQGIIRVVGHVEKGRHWVLAMTWVIWGVQPTYLNIFIWGTDQKGYFLKFAPLGLGTLGCS